MSDRTDVLTLLAKIQKSREVLNRINRFHDSRFGKAGTGEQSTEQGIVLAEILGNYYTCLETISPNIPALCRGQSWSHQCRLRFRNRLPGLAISTNRPFPPPRVLKARTMVCAVWKGTVTTE